MRTLGKSHARASCRARPPFAIANGETFRILSQEAIPGYPDWVLLTTFNEWHEGSEIEPSIENGTRELSTTKKFAPTFLGK